MPSLSYPMPEEDAAIVRALDQGGTHASAVAARTGLPRTTARYRMEKMCAAGLLEKSVSGRRVLYRLKNARRLSGGYGRADLVELYAPLLSLPRNAVVYVVQGAGAAQAELSRLPRSFIERVHHHYKRNRIVMKAVSHESILAVTSGLDATLTKSHIGRTLGLKLFRQDLFRGDAEIFITRKFVLLTHPRAEEGVVVQDRAVCELLFELAEVFFNSLDHASSVDLNAWMRTLLRES